MAEKRGFFKKLGGKLKAIAPFAATALGGPAGGIAATIMKRKFGDETMGDESLLENVLGALQSPEGMQKIREIEADLQKAELELDLNFEELAVSDRASARDLGKERGTVFQMSLSGAFLGGYFMLIWLFFARSEIVPMDEWSRGQLGILIGILTAAVPQILAYWFGSSSGSSKKTNMLAGLNPKP